MSKYCPIFAYQYLELKIYPFPDLVLVFRKSRSILTSFQQPADTGLFDIISHDHTNYQEEFFTLLTVFLIAFQKLQWNWIDLLERLVPDVTWSVSKLVLDTLQTSLQQEEEAFQKTRCINEVPVCSK